MGLVVRIGQAAHIKHQIGIERYAVLEAERFKQQHQPVARCGDEFLDPGAQPIRCEFAGIDVVSQFRRARQQFAIARDAFAQRLPPIRQRVAAACFGKTLDQRIVFRIQVEHFEFDAALAQAVHVRGEIHDVVTRPRVHGKRHAFVRGRRQGIHQVVEQRTGKVIHAVVAGVFQRSQCHAFA